MALLLEECYSNLKYLDPSEYYQYSVIKKGKKSRIISSPHPLLKTFQKAFAATLEDFPFHSACMSRKGKGIVANANAHYRNNPVLIYKTDIKNFFDNTSIDKVERAISEARYTEPTNLRHYQEYLFSQGGKSSPQGSPASPILADIAGTAVDSSLGELEKFISLCFVYTRYVDDITISFSSNDMDIDRVHREVSRIVSAAGYELNEEKTECIRPNTSDKFRVTGINVIPNKNQVPRKTRNVIKARINNHARNNEPLDDITKGLLSFVQSISIDEYNKLIRYVGKRKSYFRNLFNDAAV